MTVLIIGIRYSSYVKMRTFTLSGDEIVKSEQIQPVSGSMITANEVSQIMNKLFTQIYLCIWLEHV